jgi:hypothetical protein
VEEHVTEIDGPRMNVQSAPWPTELADLVAACTYRPGWSVELIDGDDRGQDCHGLTVEILVRTQNTYPPHGPISVRHLFGVPAAGYNRESWRWWLFECFLSVERHEAMEWFTVAGEKPYAPNHGPGWNPYLITVVATDTDRRTQFDGRVVPDPHETCTDCGRPRVPDHDADADGPTVRHPFRSIRHQAVMPEVAHYEAHPPTLRDRLRHEIR